MSPNGPASELEIVSFSSKSKAYSDLEAVHQVKNITVRRSHRTWEGQRHSNSKCVNFRLGSIVKGLGYRYLVPKGDA